MYFTPGNHSSRIAIFVFLLAGILFLAPQAKAQLVGGEAFMQGTYLEVGVSNCGSFGTTTGAPAGYHDNVLGGALGFVADADKDGWGTSPVGGINYCGDYFLPGSPEEGFGVEIAGITRGNFGQCGTNQITGAVTGYTYSGGIHTTTWEGNDRGLGIVSNTFFHDTSLYFVTRVILTNTTAAPINNIYFFRNVDPDNEQPTSGSFMTTNTIVYNNGPMGEALVSAVGVDYGCYLGLGTMDSRARVSWGGFFVRDGSDVWDGVAGYSGTGTTLCDCAISLSFNIGTLNPGDTTCIAYAYILNEDDLDDALAATSSPTYMANSVDISDTCCLNVCAGEPVDLEILNGAGYNWTWTPSTGLSTTTGTIVTATPTTTTTYTITGTNPCGTFTKDLTIFVDPDALPPNLLCPPPASTISCPSYIPDYVGLSLATDNCTAEPDIVWNQTPAPGTIAAPGVTPVTISATDLAGNTSNCMITVTVPSNVSLALNAITPPTCTGSADGFVSVTASSGTPPYSYLWSSGVTGSAFPSLTAGPHSCTVTDAGGCFDVVSFTVTAPAAHTVLLDTYNDADCNGASTGTASVLVSGGTPGYTYAWSNGETGVSASALPAGTNTVTVTDANSCEETLDVVIGEPSAISFTSSITDAGCAGSATGAITLSPSGGTPGYSYSWGSGATGPTVSGLISGIYPVTITDAIGCTNTTSITVGEASPIALTLTPTNSTCPDVPMGSATVSAGGGTPGYSYNWSSGATGTTATGLAPGPQSVTVTDANGCTQVASTAITQPPSFALSPSSNIVTCNGGSDGEASIVVSGATPGYSYAWSDGQTTPTATGLGSGTYTCTITDANGCTSQTSVFIAEPTALLTSISGNDATCNGVGNGSAVISTSGGAPGYGYAWNTSPPQSTAFAGGLPAGSYSVTVTDASGCQAIETVTIGEPSLIVIAGSDNPAACGNPNGEAIASASGGFPGYTYNWGTTPPQTGSVATGLLAGFYDVTVTDAVGCQQVETVEVTNMNAPTASLSGSGDVTCSGASDGFANVSVSGMNGPFTYVWNTSPPQTGSSATALPGGTFTMVTTDAVGCQDSVTVVIDEPTPVVNSLNSISDVSCFGSADGRIDVLASGGTGGLSYEWNTVPPQLSAVATGLAPGDYVVTIRDGNGCTLLDTFTVLEPAALALTPSSVGANCGQSNGSATVSVSGGTAGYTYSWNTSPPETSSGISGFPAGSYSVTVTDANGCEETQSILIENLNAPSASITDQENVSCFGESDGSATSTVIGEFPPFTYSWNTTPPQLTPVATGLAAGVYRLVVTDSAGCEDSIEVVISEPDELLLTTDFNGITCYGDADGSAEVFPVGGVPGYSYEWSTSPVQSTALANNLTEGTYIIAVTDANGCSALETITIPDVPEVIAGFNSNPAMPAVINIAWPDVSFQNISDNAISWTWDFGDGVTSSDQNPQHTYTSPGSYCVTLIAEDGSGCKDAIITCNYEIIKRDLHVPNTFTPNGDGVNDNFEIVGIENFPENTLQIFNRWGEKVFEAEHYNNEWTGLNKNGKALPDGAYFYVLFPNGEEEEKRAGDLVIFR